MIYPFTGLALKNQNFAITDETAFPYIPLAISQNLEEFHVITFQAIVSTLIPHH